MLNITKTIPVDILLVCYILVALIGMIVIMIGSEHK